MLLHAMQWFWLSENYGRLKCAGSVLKGAMLEYLEIKDKKKESMFWPYALASIDNDAYASNGYTKNSLARNERLEPVFLTNVWPFGEDNQKSPHSGVDIVAYEGSNDDCCRTLKTPGLNDFLNVNDIQFG